MKKILTIALCIIAIFQTTISPLQAQVYCTLSGDVSTEEWIQTITIGDFSNTSNNDNGYGSFSNQNIDLIAGFEYHFSLVPGFVNNTYTEYWRIWIDYNNDGDFSDSNELVFDSNEGSSDPITDAFIVPENVQNISTRMRIAMKYVGNISSGNDDFAAPNACGTFAYGEVEDYTVNITSDNYCLNTGSNSAEEWIESISIGPFSNTSGNNNGYADLSNNTIELETGTEYDLTLNPGFSGNAYNEHWRVWIDYNKDNDFDDANELVYDSEEGLSNPINTSITIWENAPLGESRLRVAMKYVGDFNSGASDLAPPNSCGSFEYGEVEDYTISLSESTSVQMPIAAFNSSANVGAAPLTIEFFDQSNNAEAWSWSFPGGTPAQSNEANPIVTYNTSGVYTVYLTVTNAAGSHTETKTNYVNVAETVIPPIADFTSSLTTGGTNVSIDFTDLSTSNPSSWNWTFQGGSPASSSQQNPTVVYTTPGIYAVTLVAGNTAGTDIETKQGYIHIVETVFTPIADFEADLTSGGTSLLVNFFDLSTNNPTNWTWTFQGGTPATSTLQNPSVTYYNPGTYVVTLVASNSAGSDNEIKQGFITVEEPLQAPVADFSTSQTSGTAPFEVNFFDQSTNEPATWTWSFQGGTPGTSTQQNPTVNYQVPGTYEVSLTCANAAGASMETKTGFITVEEPAPLPIASFGASVYEGNPPLDVSFFDISTNDPIAWDWEFPGATPSSSNEKNPTVQYDAPGNFPVTLTVTNGTGSDTKMQLGYIKIVPVLAGAEEISWEAELYLYPNPSTDYLNIEIDFKEPTQASYHLYNLLGQEVFSKDLSQISTINEQVNLSDVPSGSYFLQIEYGTEKISKMIQVVK